MSCVVYLTALTDVGVAVLCPQALLVGSNQRQVSLQQKLLLQWMYVHTSTPQCKGDQYMLQQHLLQGSFRTHMVAHLASFSLVSWTLQL